MAVCRLDTFDAALNNAFARRTLKAVTPLVAPLVIYRGRSLCNFASNDYLNLSRHPLLEERSIAYIRRYGANNQSSRLVTGNLHCYEQLERKLAQLTGFEAAVIFPSGYQLNSAVISSLLTATDLALVDSAAHRSIVEGIKQSRARFKRFAHLDHEALEEKLAVYSTVQREYTSKWIFAESVYSVDGSVHDIDCLANTASQKGCNLYIDDAHAVGVLGKNGMGLVAGRRDVKLAMGCFSKGLGAFGGYLLCSKLAKEYLVNSCPGLIYTTALPPAVLGAIDASLEIVPHLDRERASLQKHAEKLRNELISSDFDIGASASNIVSVYFDSKQKALALSKHLENCGILAVALRPPTTADDRSAVRFSLTCAHREEDLDFLVSSLRKFKHAS